MGGPSMYYVNKLLIKSQGGKRVRFLIRHTFPLTRGLCQAAHYIGRALDSVQNALFIEDT